MNTKPAHWVIKINKKWVIRSLIGVPIALLLYILVTPTYCDNTNRARVSEIILSLSSARTEVTEFIQTNPEKTPLNITELSRSLPPLGQFGKMESMAGEPVIVEYVNISESGQITITTTGINAFLQLTPTVVGNQVMAWHCYGKPHKVVPGSCRDERLATGSSGAADGATGQQRADTPSPRET